MKAGFLALGEVSEFIRGITFTPNDIEEVATTNTVGVMRTKNVQEQLDLNDVWKINRIFVKNKNQYLEEGDLLVSSANSWNLVGKASWVPLLDYESSFGGFVTVLRGNKKLIDRRYLYYWFVSDRIQNLLRSFSNKTTNISNLSLSRAKELLIPLPPIAEQQRIAALLDTADRILKQRESSIAKLDQIAQSVFVEMLKDVKNCRAVKKLGEICDVRDGTHDSPKYVNEGVPLITSKNLTNGFIDLSNVNLISDNDLFEINKRSKVDYDDILMPMIGTIGNPVIVKDQNPKFAIKNVALIKQIAGSPKSIYLKAVLESASFKSYVEKISRGGTQKFLGLGDIRKFEFAVVDKKNEDEFVNFINKLNSMRDLYSINALKQKEMFASLQHQSFAVN
jgi:type I restriction enzyme S subunit